MNPPKKLEIFMKKYLVLSAFLLPIFLLIGLVGERVLDQHRDTDSWFGAVKTDAPEVQQIGTFSKTEDGSFRVSFTKKTIVTEFNRWGVYSLLSNPGIVFVALIPEDKFGPKNLQIGIKDVLQGQGLSWYGMVYDLVAWKAGQSGKYVPGHSPAILPENGLVFAGFKVNDPVLASVHR